MGVTMKRNIIISFATHLLVSLFCFACILVSIQLGRIENRIAYTLEVFFVLFVCFSYYFAGRHLMIPVDGKNKSFLSVCILGSVLMFIVLIGIIINISTPDGNLGSFIVFISNPATNIISSFIFAPLWQDNTPDKISNLFLLTTPILPTLGLSVGLFLRKKTVENK